VRRALLILTAVVSLGSCAKNPFNSRESEAPTSEGGTFIPPTSPQIVLENLRLSYTQLVISNFIQSLDSQFVFRFDVVEGIATDTSWGFQAEISLTEKLFNDFTATKNARGIRIVLSPQAGQSDQILDSTATLVRKYRLMEVDSLGREQASYEGVSRFELVESAFNYWSLRLWEDIHLSFETKSWAELKYAYR